MGFPGGSDGKESVCTAGDLDSISALGEPLKQETATRSSILCFCATEFSEIPLTEEPGGPQFVGCRVGHD